MEETFILSCNGQIFILFKAYVELHLNQKIKTVQTNWDDEYWSFTYYHNQHGIAYHPPCLHTHEQHGKAEHKHRHIIQTIFPLLTQASQPLKFWHEACTTNESYWLPYKSSFHTHPLLPITLGELYLKLPSHSYVWIFGCAYYPYLHPISFNIKKQKRMILFIAFLTNRYNINSVLSYGIRKLNYPKKVD